MIKILIQSSTVTVTKSQYPLIVSQFKIVTRCRPCYFHYWFSGISQTAILIAMWFVSYKSFVITSCRCPKWRTKKISQTWGLKSPQNHNIIHLPHKKVGIQSGSKGQKLHRDLQFGIYPLFPTRSLGWFVGRWTKSKIWRPLANEKALRIGQN